MTVAGETPTSARPVPLDLDDLVRRLVAARRGGARLEAADILAVVKSSDAAYAVQARVDALLWPEAGDTSVWKAGADSRDALPTAAPIAPPLVHASGATLSARQFGMLIVEAEIAYRFGIDLPPRATPYSAAEVGEAVAAMHVAIEIVDPRIADFATAPPLAKLADHLVNGAFVLGDGITDWRRIDLRRQKAILSIDGKAREVAEGSHSLGNPAVLLPWFVAHLGKGGEASETRGVRAGDVVTTGSWTKVVEAKAGQRIAVEFPGIGSACLIVAA